MEETFKNFQTNSRFASDNPKGLNICFPLLRGSGNNGLQPPSKLQFYNSPPSSNEMAGDGDIPHPSIGNARRMQVRNVNMQCKVMIEIVENHMRETIVIDEIGTELEALAASTIAQRGIQLVGIAHGMTVENLIKNPSLEILVGGIQSVTPSDEVSSSSKNG
ncbi:hypothetical protein SUGI_0419270 [Cryptomeria japonica]|nr:hypothetical protein SUGI_0419270 [Cryptomeria japonica]